MFRLSNGFEVDYVAASGALGHDGCGWPYDQPFRWAGLLDETLFVRVLKTLTLPLTIGNLRWYNPFDCIRFIKDGVVNAVGLSNKGFDWWEEKIAPKINFMTGKIAVSIAGEPDELCEMARRLNRYDLAFIEFNSSCPNSTELFLTSERIIAGCQSIKVATNHPLVLKISVSHDYATVVSQTIGLIEAIAVNSVPWSIVFPNKISPLNHLGGGGVSGKAAQPFTWAFARKIVDMHQIPVIGPSVWQEGDIEYLRQLGVSAVSCGSLFMRDPSRPTALVRQDKQI